MNRGKWVAGRGSGPAQGLPRGSPRGAHQNEPKCLKYQGVSCFSDHFGLPSRPASCPQILAPSPVNRKSIFSPAGQKSTRIEPNCCLIQCFSYDFDDFGCPFRASSGPASRLARIQLINYPKGDLRFPPGGKWIHVSSSGNTNVLMVSG